jgi:hopanoid biosynthesis associated RND transporter like protein HpnN
VDFGIHFSLRVEEDINAGVPLDGALRGAAAGVGGALALTAVAAAIGFFSFLPTAYRGLSELGLISGVGMFIALLANLTVLPAMLTLLPPAKGRRGAADVPVGRLEAAVERHARAIAWGALGLAVVAASSLPWARFDDDPLNLRDPESASVATLLDIIEDPRVQPYAVSVLTPGPAAAAALAERLAALPEVAGTVTLIDYVPKQQDDKLAVIEETAMFLTPLWGGSPVAPPNAGERRRALVDLRAAAAALAAGPGGASAERLRAALARLDDGDAALELLERALLANLPGRLAALGEALEAGPVALQDLPEALVSRKLAADGRSTVEVHPAADLRARGPRQRFVDAVQSLVPDATGAPIIITEAGRAVVEAFLQAAGISVLLISLLLLAILRSVRDSLLVLAPLVVAALLTVAATVIFGRPFNFANVIVLPLLFGLGVAGGIHMVARSRHEAATALMSTSTPRAVLFSALTTIGSFCALALSSHPGTASMGELLTIAIGLSMLACLIVLPALLVLSGRVAPDTGKRS